MSLEENGTKRKASDELSDEDDQVTAAKLPAKRSKDCPYLDSINRKVLDFGKLKKHSLILLNIKSYVGELNLIFFIHSQLFIYRFRKILLSQFFKNQCVRLYGLWQIFSRTRSKHSCLYT